MITLRTLGSGNAFNQEGRLNSSYLIEFSGKNILIDCGFTTPLGLQNSKIDFNELDYIFITHYHGDHYGGLAALLLGLKYVSVQKKTMKIVGPDALKDTIQKLIAILYKGNENIVNELDIDFISVSSKGGSLDFEGFKVEALPMIHTEESLPVGYCFDFGSTTVGFTGDSGWHSGIEELIKKSDTSIVECNFIEYLTDSHLSVNQLEASEVIQSKKSNVYLTHLNEAVAKEAARLGYHCLKDGFTMDLV